jgi:hypothetical protein
MHYLGLFWPSSLSRNESQGYQCREVHGNERLGGGHGVPDDAPYRPGKSTRTCGLPLDLRDHRVTGELRCMQPIQSRIFAFLTHGILLGTLAAGCAGEIDNAPSDDELTYTTAGELTWTKCATQGRICQFQGTRQVRYTAGTQSVTRIFSNSVNCNNRSFGVRFSGVATCYLGAEDAPVATPIVGSDAGMNMGGSGSSADAGMNMGSGSTTSTTMAGMGPTVDRSKIPTGNPGVSGVEISTTGERPSASDGVGAFRTRCQFSHMNFDDPIVFPGQPNASHLHSFFGNSLTDANSTPASLRNGGNSTCRGGIANRSAYWVPSIVDTSNGAPVAPVEADIYYKTGYNGINPADVRPFPSGLRMIAGNAKSADPQAHVYWGCFDNYIGHPSEIPNCPAGDRVVMAVVFPQCWDGVNTDSADHKSHMAYAEGGRCPSTHPVAIPEISFNVYYMQPAGGTSSWRLSSDMYDTSKPGGYSAHGDYFEGWDPEIVKTFVANCDNTGLDCHSHLLGDGRIIYNSRE